MRLLRLAPMLVSLGGCLNPDDILVIRGAVTSIDGVAGQRVALWRGADPLPSLPREYVPRNGCGEFVPVNETTTDEGGSWSLEILRAQAEGLTGPGRGRYCFRVDTHFASGSEAFAVLSSVSRETRVTAFPDWRAQPSLDGGHLAFEPLAPISTDVELDGAHVIHRARLVTADGSLAWSVDDLVQGLGGVLGGDGGLVLMPFKRQPIHFSSAILEDFAGSIQLSGQMVQRGTGELISDPAEGIEASSADTVEARGTRTPISRGIDCPPFPSPCPFTDGALVPVDAGGVEALDLDLPHPTQVRELVVRGLEVGSDSLAVTLYSADGGVAGGPSMPMGPFVPLSQPMWARSGSLKTIQTPNGNMFVIVVYPHFISIPLDAGVPASRVHLEFPSGAERISEISLFE